MMEGLNQKAALDQGENAAAPDIQHRAGSGLRDQDFGTEQDLQTGECVMPSNLLDTDLHKRINLTRDGQVTWAKPALGETCETCTHLGNIRSKRNGAKVARCKLVELHSRKQGKEFEVDGAIACSMWSSQS